MIFEYKNNIYANIKEQNIINYVPAGKITRCYSVTFVKERTYTLFGKIIKKHSTSETMPFTFKTLDVAKDFCEICPTIISDVFVNNSGYCRLVKYHTYRLVKNGKIIGYIKWDPYYTHNNFPQVNNNTETNIEFSPFLNDKIVGKFVDDITLKYWIETDSLNDVIFSKPCDYLSELIRKKETIQVTNHETYKEWNFKLVEQ